MIRTVRTWDFLMTASAPVGIFEQHESFLAVEQWDAKRDGEYDQMCIVEI